MPQIFLISFPLVPDLSLIDLSRPPNLKSSYPGPSACTWLWPKTVPSSVWKSEISGWRTFPGREDEQPFRGTALAKTIIPRPISDLSDLRSPISPISPISKAHSYGGPFWSPFRLDPSAQTPNRPSRCQGRKCSVPQRNGDLADLADLAELADGLPLR